MQHGQVAAQFVGPVRPLPFTFRAGQELLLPGHEVAVLCCRQRQLRLDAGTGGKVEGLDFLAELQGRTQVHGKVMERGQEHVLLSGQGEEIDPEHGTTLQIERFARFLEQMGTQLVRSPAGGIGDLQADSQTVVNLLDRFAFVDSVSRSQDRMALRQPLEDPSHDHYIDPQTQTPGIGFVVGRAARVQLLQEPQGPLTVGKRKRLRAAGVSSLVAGFSTVPLVSSGWDGVGPTEG